MKKILIGSTIVFLAACDPAANLDAPQGTQGKLGDANVACVERGGLLVGKRGGGVICKLPNGQIVDQLTLL